MHLPINIQFLALTLFFVVLRTNSHEFKIENSDVMDNENESVNNEFSGRLLQTTRKAIRITLDTSQFSTVNSGTTASNLNFIKRTMQVTEYFFQKRIKVTEMTRVFAPSLCVDYTPASTDVVTGISSSDLHIYVRYLTNSTVQYGASGKFCKSITGITLPDSTLQSGRPTVGRIIFNTQKLVDGQTLTNRLFSSVTATAMHEFIHVLGFDSELYDYYLNPSTNNVYASVYQEELLVHSDRNTVSNMNKTYKIVTPFVTAWAKDFFACANITGMLLENQDATNPGSHWERTAVYDEIMSGTSLGPSKGISGLTFSLLKDMGWYEVDASFNDTSNYGYHKGCSFYFDACYGTSFTDSFCNVALNTDVSLCASNFLGKAVCNSDYASMTDGCGMYASYLNCVDVDVSNDGYRAYSFESYGTTSFCVTSTLGTVSLSQRLKSRCYPYVCNSSSSSIRFTVGTKTVTCSSSDEGVSKNVVGMFGTLVCPKFESFCTQSRKTCPNWCSQNGFCTRGICNCLPGFNGQDCSIIICTDVQFYNPTNNTCLITCPEGTYQNAYSKTCMPCDDPCQQCRDEPKICTQCVSTLLIPKYYYSVNGSCLTSCPSTTYQAGDVCLVCDATVSKCQTCSITATNCTSCLGGLFLSTPTFGSCVAVCSANTTGIYIRSDVQNYKCVQSCVDNLIEVGTTCAKCPGGQFKMINDSSCNAFCPSRFYNNSVNSLCEQCDSSCYECDGIYAENCTKCLTSSSQKYLLLKMCLISCPKSYYADNVAGECFECPDNLNCQVCEFQSNTSTIYCSSCKSGYFFSNKTCFEQCDPGYYKNTWNNSCDSCNGSCEQCTNSDSTSCTSCLSTKFYLSNATGGYCITGCPSNYIASGRNCLACHFTCLTCIGVSSSSCSQCATGLYRYSGLCRYVCPSATYADASDQTCKNCNSNCSYCLGPTANNCTSCISTLYLNNYTCVTRCPDTLRENQWKVCYSSRTIWLMLTTLIVFGLIFS